MGHVAVSNLAYAHPGGDTLFFDVSFRLPAGRHAGLIGTNGVGKSTLMRIAAGELQALEGDIALGGRRIVRTGLDAVGDRPALTLSGGERKRLVLELLFASDASVLLLDEPDNFLDVPAKRALEAQLAATKKTVLVISHDRELLAGAVQWILTLEGNGAWLHGG